jgi:hypothetical protein
VIIDRRSAYEFDPIFCSNCRRPQPKVEPGWCMIGLDGDPWLYCPECLELMVRERKLREDVLGTETDGNGA